MKVFDKFVAPDYVAQGRRTFQEYVASAKIRERYDGGADRVWTAKAGPELVGVIALREEKHISLLFVAEAWQRRGIARGLVGRAIRELETRPGAARQLTVNSAPYAVTVYEKLGFQKLGAEQERDGIRFVPMKADLGSRGAGDPDPGPGR
jgi:GNAT superfamily N-acetyltransferase